MSAAKSSTATGTIATAEVAVGPVACRGRFAPSPTGLLHIGSLVTALASYLDTRSRGGAWLVRMEDLDVARAVPGAADAILRTLDRLGLQSDEAVLYQSNRSVAYRDALHALAQRGLTYECSCTRSELANETLAGSDPVYPGYCRNGPRHAGATATRLRTGEGDVTFGDALHGLQQLGLASLGDPIIRRRDGIAAYQLAVVVDDHFQRVSRVVRGEDLLPSTAWQVRLQQGLGYPTPVYLHVPLVVEHDGSKLAKSRHSLPVDALDPSLALWRALQLLQQAPEVSLRNSPVTELLTWAMANWDATALQGKHLLALPQQ